MQKASGLETVSYDDSCEENLEANCKGDINLVN